MKNFLADLRNDLRAKRLWPVAVVLLVGLIAVPLVFMEDRHAPPAAPPASASDERGGSEPSDFRGLAAVDLEEVDPGDGSTLDTFDPSDPFRPPTRVLERAREEASDGTQAGPSGDPTGGTDSSGDTGTGGGQSSSGDTGSTGDSGGGGDDGGDTGGGDEDGGSTVEYAYVIDVTFRANGRTRKIHGMERLDMLPNPASPLLIFLGASANGGNAVFLVDSTLEAAGEGKCKPSPGECAFLYLGAGSEHAFTNDEGDSYELRVDEIRKVKLKATPSSARGRLAAGAAVGRSGGRRFLAPIISDLVSVSSDTHAGSDRGHGRR